MIHPPLLKTSPLSGLYRRYPVQLDGVAGWQIALHFGNPAREQEALQTGAVLADWSHLGKVAVAGREAALRVEALVPGAAVMAPLTSLQTADRVVLRLTGTDYLLLCPPGQSEACSASLGAPSVTVIDQSGALGCFVLAGPRRDEVWERSTALNLRRDIVLPGAVLQSTLHTVRCTVHRRPDFDVILHPRSLSESLFSALMDVGVGVGLVPGGIITLPVTLLSCEF